MGGNAENDTIYNGAGNGGVMLRAVAAGLKAFGYANPVLSIQKLIVIISVRIFFSIYLSI